MTGQDDDVLRLEGGDLPRPALANEAQLAAALVMQAQALDAMRRAHSDLLARIEQGPEREVLLGALEELRASTDGVREAQERAGRRLARARRRLVGLAVLALVVAGGGAAAAVWAASSVAEGLPAARADLAAALAAQEQSRRAQDEALAGLTARLDRDVTGLQQRAAAADDARDAAQQALAAERQRADAADAGLAELRRDRDSQQLRAEHERDEHLTALGDNARLHQELIDRDRKLDELTHTLAALQPGHAVPAAAGAAPTAGIVPAPATAAGLSGRVTAALHASGVKDVAVVEAAEVRDGVLLGLLVVHEATDSAPSSATRAERGAIVVAEGGPALELTSAGAAPEDVPLPALDRESWKRLGVAVPDAAVSVARLSDALSALISPQGWRVAELRGWDGDALRGLRLEQADSTGHVSRVLRADRGQMLPGPELELRDGTLKVGDDERAFFQGVFRLPLPGGDFGAWLAALQAQTR